MAMDFVKEKEEIMIQREAYKICDTVCKVDPLKCASRYGNHRRCSILGKELTKLFGETSSEPEE